MIIIKVLVDEMPSGCKRCNYCVAKMYCLLLEDRKTTVPDEPYKRRPDCPLVYDFSDKQINDLTVRIAELEAEIERLTAHSDIERQDAEERAHLEKLVPDLKKRIAELEDDNRSLGDSGAWLKQNYEDLERDYGTMYDKLCARIDKLTAENKGLEDVCEILRKENKRLFSKVFSNAYRKEREE